MEELTVVQYLVMLQYATNTKITEKTFSLAKTEEINENLRSKQ